jgi:glycosyltransferase involved in cell wall biosynthesis
LFDDTTFITIEEFYAVIDLYLSPSRVEGFGLNLVEASQMRIPVITSGWRLAPQIADLPHIHTVDYDLVPIVDPQGQYIHGAGKRWSEPRLESVVAKLRLLQREHHRL